MNSACPILLRHDMLPPPEEIERLQHKDGTDGQPSVRGEETFPTRNFLWRVPGWTGFRNGTDSVRIRNRNLIRTLARILAFFCRCLYATCRIRVIEGAPLTSPYAPCGEARYVYCLWHDGILNALFCGRVMNGAALTSQHTDGEYVAEVMEVIGIQPVRGSYGGRGGAAAARQLVQAAEKFHIVVTTDGPRGPRRTVKPGIFFLASQTGRPIVPVACSARNAWRPKGRWTDLIIPCPFSRVYVLGGEPMSIPPNLQRNQLGDYCQELQQRMDDLQQQADDIAMGKPVSSPVTVRKNAA